MLRGAIQGGQGMIANTRVSLSPVGKPADAQVIQRYYQENAWLDGLAKRQTEQIWQYPYDRPHCYLLTDIEAYLDLYLVTGEKRYFDAALGAWEMYRAHWQQAGGSISIIEFENDPPDSNYLRQKLGELCGSSFWVFLSQRFQLLDPENERYAAEIEKSIYNVGIANQDGANGFRYHTILEGQKEKVDAREHLLRRPGNAPGRLAARTHFFPGSGRSVCAPLRGRRRSAGNRTATTSRSRCARAFLSTTLSRPRSRPRRRRPRKSAFACPPGPSARWGSR